MAAPMKLRSSRRALSQIQLAEHIRQQIATGVLRAGDRLLSYNEMRRQHGVHSVAVQRVYEQLAREGLIVREQGRGTFVADIVPGPRQKAVVRQGTIGVAGKGFAFREYSPYWVNLLCGIRQVCDEAENQILLLDFESNRGWEKADGVLICDWSNRMTMQFLPPGMPCVSVMVPAPNIASVYADDYCGAHAATGYLLKLGHRNIACLHSKDAFVSERRRAGWREALLAHGIAACPSWERNMGRGKYDFGERFVTRGHLIMSRWLQSDWAELGCTAILAQNDETAIGVIQALREAKIRVPEDVSVVGFDGVQGEYSSLRLTTMEVPLKEIGKAAMSLLLREVNQEKIGAAHHVFPVALRTGQSSGPVKNQERVKEN
jgi:DNA-binding LacI/PurR family transcriptional regulator